MLKLLLYVGNSIEVF